MTSVNLFMILYLIWLSGWIVSSIIYLLVDLKYRREINGSFLWSSTIIRLILLSLLWPILLVTIPFLYRSK